MLEKIISGGQTGVDRAALDFAIAHNIAHGGWCPRGRLAEDGVIELRYALKETPEAEYKQRTEWNVRDSDGTVIFTSGSELAGGSAATRDFAIAYGKPWLHLSETSETVSSAARKLDDFILRNGIRVLNIAGPRLSTEPKARFFAHQVLEKWYRDLRQK